MPGPCNGAALDSLAKWTASLDALHKVIRVIDETKARLDAEAEPAII
jgi:hypothetical protein